MDLPKASDTIHYGLLAKLKTYGFSKQALSFMCSLQLHKEQETKSSNQQ